MVQLKQTVASCKLQVAIIKVCFNQDYYEPCSFTILKCNARSPFVVLSDFF